MRWTKHIFFIFVRFVSFNPRIQIILFFRNIVVYDNIYLQDFWSELFKILNEGFEFSKIGLHLFWTFRFAAPMLKCVETL